jgi:hypothetical protein
LRIATGHVRTKSRGLLAGLAGVALASTIDVVYGADTMHAVRHAQWNGTMWRFETVDGNGSLTVGGTAHPVGTSNAIAYGGAGTSLLHVFTGDTITGDVREACSTGPGILAPANCNS